MIPKWPIYQHILFWSGIVAAVCFILMPITIEQLFRSKKIGWFLDGWFDAVSAVWITLSVFFILDSAAQFAPELAPIQAGISVLVCVTTVTATVILFWRKHKLLRNPDPEISRRLELMEIAEIRKEIKGLRDDAERERDPSNTPGSSRIPYRDAS